MNDWKLRDERDKLLGDALERVAAAQANLTLVSSEVWALRFEELLEAAADDAFQAWQYSVRAATLQRAIDMIEGEAQ